MTRSPPGLIETVRVRNGMAPLWYLHLRRLANSCRALGVPLPHELRVPAGGADRVSRLEVGAGGALVTERPIGSLAPIRLSLARKYHRPYPHKTTERRQFDDALAEARGAGADDALFLVEGAEYVAEAARWSIFWWEGDRLCSPPLDFGVLPGVARARLAELTGSVLERRATLREILGRAPFVANAARGVVALAAIGADMLPPSPPRTAEIAGLFWPGS